jgi:hypothetical protein
MKTRLTALLLAVSIVGMIVSPAEAWGPHHHRRWHWGPAAFLAAPLVVAGALVAAPFVIAGSAIAATRPPVVVSAPPAVVAQSVPVWAPAPVASYWYYCQSPQGYYPYIPHCPGGWLQVVPQPGR